MYMHHGVLESTASISSLLTLPQVVFLKSLPRSPAGKLLRSQLPLPPDLPWKLPTSLQPPDEATEQRHTVHPDGVDEPPGWANPQDVGEVGVMRAFASALGRDLNDLEPTDDFFLDCGGTSLMAARLAMELKTEIALVGVAGDRN